jgi:predicted permease
MSQFISNFYTVFIQVLVLFMLMALGFVGGKIKLINEEGSKVMSNIIMYFVTPCLIINSFSTTAFDKEHLNGLITCVVAYTIIMGVSAVIGHALFRKGDPSKNKVLCFALVFSNIGYMGIPLQRAVLGEEGVFYGSVCIAVFNVVMWTYGIVCMSGNTKTLSAKKLVLNPGVVAVTIGLIIFLFSIKLPSPIETMVSSMADINTPLAMIVIGFNLGRSNIVDSLKDKGFYIVSLLRMVVIPLISLLILVLCGIKGTVLTSLVIAASAPVAAATTMFSINFNTDVKTSVNLVAFTTLLSIVSMSAIVALAQIFQ